MMTTQQSRKNATRVQPPRKWAKTDQRFWRERVKKSPGKNFYGVQIQHAGTRHFLSLGTANKDEAASRAVRLFLDIQARGWEPVLAERRPAVEGKVATVGRYIEEAEKVADLEPRTINEYKKALRRLVSEVKRIDGDGKFDWRSGRAGAWRDKVDAVRLDAITEASVQQWKRRRLMEAGTDPARQRAAKNTINALIRNAKALFGKKVLPLVSAVVLVPDPHPLSAVKLYPRQSMRYMSKIDAGEVIRIAEKELGTIPDRREQFKILLLAVCAGLRFNEIDKLLWSQVDFDRAVIRIEATEYFRPKTEEAAGEVPLDLELVAALRGWKAQATGEFVIESECPPRPGAGWNAYRARTHQKALLHWMRNLEMDGAKPLAKVQKPIHELRKEAGSLVNARHGIHAASVFLRHGDTRITAAHYLDAKRGITPGLGSMLGTGDATDIRDADTGSDSTNAGPQQSATK